MGLGDKVKDTMDAIFSPMIDLFLWPVEKGIEWGIEHLLDTLGRESSEALKPTIARLKETGEVPPEVMALLEDVENPKGQISALFGYSMARAGLGMVSTSLIGTLLAPLNAAMNAIVQPSMLDTRSIIEVELRVKGANDFTNQEWLWSGYNATRRDMLREVTRPILDAGTLRELFFRFPNLEELVDDTLKEYGFTDNQIDALKLSWPFIPQVPDLVRMAVREAFSPEIVAKFQTDADFPPEFADWAAKHGVSREMALNYWRAHWNLPSILQGFEMFHRGFIDREELDVLLRTLDVMPYWRERLTQIAYRVLTRVDVRRMHAIGVLDREGVLKAYTDLGYNKRDAGLMTDFTEQYNLSVDRELTKTDVLALYKKGTLTPDDTLAALVDMGYEEEDAYYLMEKESTAVKSEFRTLALSQVKSLARAGQIDKAEATGRLAVLGYEAEDIEHIYALWLIEFEPAVRQPSRTDLKNFYGAGIIDDDTWIDEMYKLGYPEEYIAWYYLEMTES